VSVVEGFLAGIVHRLEPMLGPAAGEPVPLSGGITNRNYRIGLGDEAYMIRLPGKDTGLLGISRDAERIANTAAAELGIAPEVVAAFDDCLVTRFVQCRAATAAELAAAPEQAARALRSFHERGPTLPVRFWVPELAVAYAAIVLERHGTVSAEYEHALDIARRIAAVRPLSSPAPCHNDLLTANLIVAEGHDTRLMLVDWEYAGMGDPFFDLGNLSINNGFDETADRRLLTAYFDRSPSHKERAALELMRAMSDVREAVWGVIQGAISELSFDFAGYAESHFARLRRTVSAARFKESLDALS
jgi:thiamine kinase-like enzyme